MAIDRTAALRNAEKLVRQGKLDHAIAEYLRVVEEQPRDWNTANTLGDLYLRAAQSDKAIQQFRRIADGFREDGFLSKAAALYRKILKIRPDDEPAQLQAAEMAAAQGLFVDARSHLHAIVEGRRKRGDLQGAAAIVVRIGTLDPADWEARRRGARAMVTLGDAPGAVAALKALAADLIGRGRDERVVEILEEAAVLDPNDTDLRIELARVLARKGDPASAAGHLGAGGAADDPELLRSLAEVHLRAGRTAEALTLADRLMALGTAGRNAVIAMAVAVGEHDAAAGHAAAIHVVERLVAEADWPGAAAVLEQFLERLPHHVPTLARLVDVSVDGGLEEVMVRAQAQLAEAHLASGRAQEARFIAEDLVIRNPGDPGHVERLRRILVAIGETEPERIIDQCLSRPWSPAQTDEPSRDGPAAEWAALPVVSDVPGAPVAPVAAPPPPLREVGQPAPQGDDALEVDLSVILDEMQKPAAAAAEPADLDEVFAGMRDQARRRLAMDAAEQDLRRGLALFRAGQVDESIPALEAASRAPRFRFETASTLGRIFLGRGELTRAIEWLERAAEAPVSSPEEGHVLLYDLADALESLGDTTRALAIYLDLEAEAGGFRDVRSRIERLARSQARG